jgi:hypothetical protein
MMFRRCWFVVALDLRVEKIKGIWANGKLESFVPASIGLARAELEGALEKVVLAPLSRLCTS